MSERFMAHIVCPKCKKKGAAVWEESEDPVYQQGQWAKGLRDGLWRKCLITGMCLTTGAASNNRYKTSNVSLQATAERKRIISQIGFPYADLESALELAQTIYSKAGSSCQVDELAA